MNEKYIQSLRCCGNCCYYNPNYIPIGDEYCDFLDTTNHPVIGIVSNDSPACKYWENVNDIRCGD